MYEDSKPTIRELKLPTNTIISSVVSSIELIFLKEGKFFLVSYLIMNVKLACILPPSTTPCSNQRVSKNATRVCDVWHGVLDGAHTQCLTVKIGFQDGSHKMLISRRKSSHPLLHLYSLQMDLHLTP